MKRSGAIIVIVLGILLTGCASGEDIQQMPESPLISDSQFISNKKPEKVENTLPMDFGALDCEMLDLDTYSLENEPSEYAQTNYPYHYISRGDAGYYFQTGQRLQLFDTESESVVTVCSKPNCRHADDSCAALVSRPKADKILSITYQNYYKGFIYFIGFDEKTQLVKLYRIAENGSSRGEYMPLYRFDNIASGVSSPYFFINRDTVYYMNNDEVEQCIRRCELGKEDRAVVFATNNSDVDICDMKVYGDFLFFQVIIVNETGDVESGIYAYNMQTGEAKLVLKVLASAYSVVQSKLIYSMEGGIYSYDLRTAETEQIVEEESFLNFVNNNEYLVLSNLKVYSLSGEYICKLAIDEFDDILGMDEEYIIVEGPAPKSDAEEYIPKLLVKKISELDDKPFTEYICE